MKYEDFNKLISNKNSFTPNLTSKLIVKNTISRLNGSDFLLDYGSGNGSIGLYLLYKKLVKKVIGIESHSFSLNESLYNRDKLLLNADYFPQINFEKLILEQPDIIINDVSGINPTIAIMSEWFQNSCINLNDPNGIELSLDLFKKLKIYNIKAKSIIFPCISLCNRELLINELKKNWQLNIIDKVYWPAPKIFNEIDSINTLQILKEKNLINFTLKFGQIIFDTEIWEAK